ncbi:hypothetical protein EYC98_01690 [Halieaceae bacterium IMCC14734]|uniref:Porin n=1 Tax=Candidatus Litorirhabdus singularis TaxID=2518993 RepID=A0ABT3TB96_9GAMM|nr:carbohydrate porin [Candidatus Litorirhabdus singularis]MCX2979568.1 hypothetical protein [Candidatus Litorirhabdus singularis]
MLATTGAGFAAENAVSAELDDEWVLETSYKLQLTPNFTLTPDLQLLINPARDQHHNQLWIAGLRAVFTI